MRIRLDIAYDGTHFRGWARQPGLRTVQGTLEEALVRILGSPVQLVVAGRTDAGVHARDQVAHLDLAPEQEERLRPHRRSQAGQDPVHALAARVRGVLGAYSDVTVSRTSVAPEGFDARFSAVWRRYEYRISDVASGVDPLRRHLVLRWPRRLDDAAMHTAAEGLVGLHDFAAFCRRREGATTTRDLQRLDVVRTRDEVAVTVQADAFCHSMVRSLVGALIAVGEGRRTPDWPVTLLRHGRRADEVVVAPAHGLTLVHVEYPPADRLAERAEQTRARRD